MYMHVHVVPVYAVDIHTVAVCSSIALQSVFSLLQQQQQYYQHYYQQVQQHQQPQQCQPPQYMQQQLQYTPVTSYPYQGYPK